MLQQKVWEQLHKNDDLHHPSTQSLRLTTDIEPYPYGKQRHRSQLLVVASLLFGASPIKIQLEFAIHRIHSNAFRHTVFQMQENRPPQWPSP